MSSILPPINQIRPTLRIFPFFLGLSGALFIPLFFYYLLTPNGGSENTYINISISIFIFSTATGLLIKYRSNFDATYSISTKIYGIFIMEICMGGFMILFFSDWIGKENNRIPILLSYLFLIIASLLFGITKNTIRTKNYKSEKIKKIILNQNLSHNKSSDGLMFVGASLSVNFSLFFKEYFGSVNNGLFVVVPLLTATFCYINIKSLAHSIVILYFARKIEKVTGIPFKNPDYEKIQELRRTFFLSRWLMKDYKPRNPQKTT